MSETKTNLTDEELKAEMNKYIQEVEAKLKEEFATASANSEENQKVNITKAGTMISIANQKTEMSDIGMILKHIQGTELKNKTDDNYVMVGIYPWEEINELIKMEDLDKQPNLTVFAMKLESEYDFGGLVTDKELAEELFDIAKQDKSIDEHVEMLLKVTVMNALTADMSHTYVENYNKRLDEADEEVAELVEQEEQ